MRRTKIAPLARVDAAAIIHHSLERFGPAAARRYRRLIQQAYADVAQAPERPGSRPFPGGLRLYPLRLAARRLPAEDRVRMPSHLIAYRFDEELVEIVRVLHEAMDLPRRLAEDVESEP